MQTGPAAASRRDLPLPQIAFCVVLAVGAIGLLVLTRNLTFYQDTWNFLLHRQHLTVHTLLEPHNEHIVVIPVAVEHLLVAVFGMTSALPETIFLVVMLLVTAGLLFVYVSRRIGPWPGVIAAAVMLSLGPAWQELLWGFQVCFIGSVACGLAMLLLLERRDQRGDVLACVALVVAILFSSVGVCFVPAALLDVWLRRREDGWRRLYVPLVPAFAFLVWYAGWGHEAEHHVTLENVLAAPRYVLDGLASSLGAVLGLNPIPITESPDPEWGRPLLIGLAALVGFRAWRGWRPSRALWMTVVIVLAYWLLAAFNFVPGREAESVRYAFTGGVLMLMLIADLAQGIRLGTKSLIAVGALACLAIGPNLVMLHEGSQFLEGQSVITKADTGAIDIARETVAPSFGLTPEIAGTPSLIDVNAAEYLPAVAAHGSPGYSVGELLDGPELAQERADSVLAAALPVTAAAEPGVVAAGSCTSYPLTSSAVEVPLRPGTFAIEPRNGASAELWLRRFTPDGFPVSEGTAPAGATTALTIPPDLARGVRWHLLIEGSQPVMLCRR